MASHAKRPTSSQRAARAARPFGGPLPIAVPLLVACGAAPPAPPSAVALPASAPPVGPAARPPPARAARACPDELPGARRAAVEAMGQDWVARRRQEPPPAEGSERWQLRVSDASAGDGFALVQHSLDARDECRERYYWLLRSVRPCAADEVEVRVAATDCCATIPCRVDARVLTFRLISAVTDRDLAALRGLLHPSEPLRASAAGVSASFTRATLSGEVFHALGDWTWPRGALPPPTACGSAVVAAGEGRRTVRCRAWAGGAPWELSWASDRLGTFLVGMRALLE